MKLVWLVQSGNADDRQPNVLSTYPAGPNGPPLRCARRHRTGRMTARTDGLHGRSAGRWTAAHQILTGEAVFSGVPRCRSRYRVDRANLFPEVSTGLLFYRLRRSARQYF